MVITDEQYEDAIVATGLLINDLFLESMWESGIDLDTVEKIRHDVATKLRKIEGLMVEESLKAHPTD